MCSGDVNKRASVIFSGRVQGVGFRFTVVDLAERRQVNGFVRNLWNGDVELVAEGPELDLLKLMKDIRSSRLGRYITRERPQWMAATGEFERFEVRY